MKKYLLMVSLLATLCVSLTLAYDATTSYTVTMSWVVPSDTTFTVSLCGTETQIDFDTNLSSATQDLAEPDCQDAGGGIPILNLTNAGNLDINLTANLTAPVPEWAHLYIFQGNDFYSATIFNVTAVNVSSDLSITETAEVYIWTNVSGATQGTTQKTLEIRAVG